MHITLATLVGRLSELKGAERAIPWGVPIPLFGDLGTSRVATVGLNPSSREFVDVGGVELDGRERRFPTLKSLALESWEDVAAEHLRMMWSAYASYFDTNPYDAWFGRLDQLLRGTDTSYYPPMRGACHLDIVPFATACKWTELTHAQRSRLADLAGDTLGVLVRDSALRLLILNGSGVVRAFEEATGTTLMRRSMRAWALRRAGHGAVCGIAFKGHVGSIGKIDLERRVAILGFNHNVQSSFGVTRGVLSSLAQWVEREAEDALR
jgi:hypothetical protein